MEAVPAAVTGAPAAVPMGVEVGTEAPATFLKEVEAPTEVAAAMEGAEAAGGVAVEVVAAAGGDSPDRRVFGNGLAVGRHQGRNPIRL